MSNILGVFPSQSQLPVIGSTVNGVTVNVGDCALTADAGGFWQAVQPSAPPGAQPAWNFLLSMRGPSGGQGAPGVGLPGPQGQIGPPGQVGAPGERGPAGKNSFSFSAQQFSVPAVGVTTLIQVTDSSWMLPGQLLYIAGAGTFTVVSAPPNSYSVNIANSGDPANSPVGTIISAGSQISPANMRGPIGPAGVSGPPGPPGPQGVSGAAAYTTLTQPFVIPSGSGTAFVASAAVFAVGLIVYVAGGQYFSVTAVNTTTNTLTLQNQNFPGGAPIGTTIPIGATISGTGPQGPPGPQGIQGIQGIQGPTSTFYPGVIFIYGGATPPAGTLKCDGAAVSRTTYSRLFAIISTTFGAGDGTSTFNLPNLVNRFPLGFDPVTYPLASTGGEINHTLLEAELAAHVHHITDLAHSHGMDHYHNIPAGQFSHAHSDAGHTHTFTSALGGGATYQPGSGWTSRTDNSGVGYANIQAATLPGGNTYNASQANGAWANTGSTFTGITATQSDGGGLAHNNMPPYTAVNFCIQT